MYSPGAREMMQKMEGGETHARPRTSPVEIIGNSPHLPQKALGFLWERSSLRGALMTAGNI